MIVGGEIGYRRLAEWWFTTFDHSEREMIATAYQSGRSAVHFDILADPDENVGDESEYNPLIEGDMEWSTQSTASLLCDVAACFDNPESISIAERCLDKAMATSEGDPIEQHEVYEQRVRLRYRIRDSSPTAFASAIAACQDHIAAAPVASVAFRQSGQDMPSHWGFKQLAIVREKEKNYSEALALSSAALSQGWKGDWEKRIARNQKRL